MKEIYGEEVGIGGLGLGGVNDLGKEVGEMGVVGLMGGKEGGIGKY